MILAGLLDYVDPLGVMMSKCWLWCARTFASEYEIVVVHDRPIPEVKAFASLLGGVRFEKMDRTGNRIDRALCGPLGSVAQEFKIPFLKHVHDAKWPPFVFVDADALIVGNIGVLSRVLSKKQPFVATTEAKVAWAKQYRIVNTGVFAYDPSSELISYEKLYLEWLSSNKVLRFPTGEQGLIIPLLHKAGYDWEHPDMGYEYNVLADAAIVDRADEGGISIRVAPKPQHLIEVGWIADWHGYGCPRPARVVHAISRWKWWNCPATEKLWVYLKSQVEKVERGASCPRPS